MNPFASPAPPEVGVNSGINTSLASTKTSAKSQINAVGASARSALGKTTNAITGVFRRSNPPLDEGSTDPLSLNNKPEKVGAEVFVANGQLWESTGDLGKAMESYTKALESEPNDPPALTCIARLHFRQGNHKLAVEFFQRAIAQTPQDAGLHNDLGLTLSKLGDYAGATQSLKKALELSPGTSRYANNLASVHFDAGDVDASYQVLAKNNKPAVAHFNMAYLHFKNGHMSKAKTHLTAALQSEPLSATDPAIARAVSRSRDMLTQIEASMAPIAQAAPQATVAGGQLVGGLPQGAKVQQTSQSGEATTEVTPAASMTPAVSEVQPPAAGAAPPVAKPLTVSKPAPAADSKLSVSTPEPSKSVEAAEPAETAKPAVPTWGTAPATAEKADRPLPTKPSSADSSDADGPSIPFALPGGFSPQ